MRKISGEGRPGFIQVAADVQRDGACEWLPLLGAPVAKALSLILTDQTFDLFFHDHSG